MMRDATKARMMRDATKARMMRDATKARLMRNPTKAKKKFSYVVRLCDLLEEYRQILIVSVDNVGSTQLQGIRQCLRGHSVVLMGKNTMMKLSIRLYAEKTGNDNFKKLADELIGNVGLIFTKGDLKEVIEEIGKYTVGAPARVGLVAPIDVVVPPGNTGLDPSQTSFFQVLNIPTKINKGTVEIIKPVELIKVGEKVGSSEAALLAKLGIRPFSYGLIIRRVYHNGSVFDPAVLDLTEDDLLEKFAIGVSMVVALSLAISYPTLAAAPHMLINGYKNILAIALATDYDYPLAEKVKQYDKDPSKFAVADEKYGTNLLLMADTDGSSHGSGSNNSNKEFTIPECLGAKYKRCLYIPTYTRNSIAGTPLAEVVSISVYPTVKCEVYGEIWVEDDKGLVDYLFKFDREKSKLISRGSYDNCLLLCQSYRTILATRFFKVHFDLKDGDSIFLKETFSWYTTTGEDYDMLLDKTILGEYGSVKMSYIVHSLAIEAHMWSIFYKSETVTSSITVKVTICVCYKNSRYDFDDSDGLLEYTRFKIFEESGLEMKANEGFLLNRKVIAVPLYYPLKIEVDLQLHGDGDVDEGRQALCHGNVEFSSTEIETWPSVEKYIEGTTGCMVVSVRGLNYARLSFDAMEGLKYRAGLKGRSGTSQG